MKLFLCRIHLGGALVIFILETFYTRNNTHNFQISIFGSRRARFLAIFCLSEDRVGVIWAHAVVIVLVQSIQKPCRSSTEMCMLPVKWVLSYLEQKRGSIRLQTTNSCNWVVDDTASSPQNYMGLLLPWPGNLFLGFLKFLVF